MKRCSARRGRGEPRIYRKQAMKVAKEMAEKELKKNWMNML